MAGKFQRKTGGRKAGTPNKATADIKAIAQPYGPGAVDALVKIMKDEAAPESARVRAASELLDRGYGKPKQAIDLEGAPIETRSLAFFYGECGIKPSVDT